MRTLYQRIIKIIAFIFVFFIGIVVIQQILHYRWCSSEDLYTRYADFSSNDSLDYVVIGTSELYAGIDPIVTYHEQGITGYNLAISYKSAMTQYYQTLYVIRTQRPKVILCDFSSLYDDSFPSNNEQVYRKVVDTMPNKAIKQRLIYDIVKTNGDGSFLSWELPLLRYHSLWNNLKDENFNRDYVQDVNYKSYTKGALLRLKTYDKEAYSTQLANDDITEQLWEYEPQNESFSNFSMRYYDLLIEECNRQNIKVIAVIPPKIIQASLYASRWEQEKEYFDSKGVEYLNYNTYEQYNRLGLILEEDYYNAAHLNVLGSIKFSKILAEDLDNMLDFDDRRLQQEISVVWDEEYKEFEKEYLSKND